MINLLDQALRGLGRLDVPATRRLINLLRPARNVPPGTHYISRFDRLTYRGSLNEYIDREIYYFGAYCPAELDFLAQAAKRTQARVFYDIGANVGQHSLWMSSRVKDVRAFEPSRSAMEQLEANSALNAIANIHANLCALGSENGEAVLGRGMPGNSGSRSLAWGGGGETVAVVRGDEFIRSHELPMPDLVKIDVEGFEKQVLNGLRLTLSKSRPVLLFEMLNRPNNPFADLKDLQNHLYEDHSLFSLAGRRRAKLQTFTWDMEQVVCIPSEKLHVFHGIIPNLHQ